MIWGSRIIEFQVTNFKWAIMVMLAWKSQLWMQMKYARSKKTAIWANKKALFRCHVCRNMATMYCKTCTRCLPHNTSRVQHHICTQVKVHKWSLHAWSKYLMMTEISNARRVLMPIHHSFQYCFVLYNQSFSKNTHAEFYMRAKTRHDIGAIQV